MYESFSIIFALSALLSYINYKYLKLPSTIGQLLLALLIAIVISGLQYVHIPSYTFFCNIVQDANFSHVLLDVLLGFLLFGGAMHVNIYELNRQRITVFLLASFGVLLSTIIVGTLIFFLSQFLGIDLPFLHALLFGALISPTDPVAVLAILKDAKVDKSLRLKIEGESLFNDGVGVVVFSAILLLVNSSGMMHDMDTGNIILEILILFFEEIVLGLALGLILAILGFRLIQSVSENTHMVTILSLALVFGGYSLANMIHTSGPLAMVVAGLYIGHQIRKKSFNIDAERNLEGIWSILDESLNGVLFVMMGLALHLIPFPSMSYVALAILAIIVVLLARLISVSLPYSFLMNSDTQWKKTVLTLTWGGLRGGISLALAFSISAQNSGDLILFLTYAVMGFSVLVQGMSIAPLIKRMFVMS